LYHTVYVLCRAHTHTIQCKSTLLKTVHCILFFYYQDFHCIYPKPRHTCFSSTSGNKRSEKLCQISTNLVLVVCLFAHYFVDLVLHCSSQIHVSLSSWISGNDRWWRELSERKRGKGERKPKKDNHERMGESPNGFREKAHLKSKKKQKYKPQTPFRRPCISIECGKSEVYKQMVISVSECARNSRMSLAVI